MKRVTTTLPACFDNFFCFQDQCDVTPPASGLTFDMLPGVSRDVVSAWTDSGKHLNADEFTKTAFIRALAVMRQKLTGSLSAMGVEMNPHPERVTACELSDRLAPPASGVGWRGQRVAMRDKSSKFSCLRVESVTVKTCSAENIVLQILDENYMLVHSVDVATLPHTEKVIRIDKDFDSQILYIGFSQGGVVTYESDCQRGGACCLSAKHGAYSRLLLVDGWDGTFSDAGTVRSVGYGVASCVSIVCKKDNLLCCFRDELAWPLLYATGVQMLLEAKASRRINPETIVLDTNADETLAMWSAACDDALAACLNTIKTKAMQDKTCFACCHGTPGFINSTS